MGSGGGGSGHKIPWGNQAAPVTKMARRKQGKRDWQCNSCLPGVETSPARKNAPFYFRPFFPVEIGRKNPFFFTVGFL